MRIPNAVPDAPVYKATLREMENLPELLAVAGELAAKHGAVRIDPPPEWEPPPLRMASHSKFFVREQTLPAAPFVDLSPPDVQLVQKRRRRVVNASDDEEEHLHAVTHSNQNISTSAPFHMKCNPPIPASSAKPAPSESVSIPSTAEQGKTLHTKAGLNTPQGSACAQRDETVDAKKSENSKTGDNSGNHSSLQVPTNSAPTAKHNEVMATAQPSTSPLDAPSSVLHLGNDGPQQLSERGLPQGGVESVTNPNQNAAQNQVQLQVTTNTSASHIAGGILSNQTLRQPELAEQAYPRQNQRISPEEERLQTNAPNHPIQPAPQSFQHPHHVIQVAGTAAHDRLQTNVSPVHIGNTRVPRLQASRVPPSPSSSSFPDKAPLEGIEGAQLLPNRAEVPGISRPPVPQASSVPLLTRPLQSPSLTNNRLGVMPIAPKPTSIPHINIPQQNALPPVLPAGYQAAKQLHKPSSGEPRQAALLPNPYQLLPIRHNLAQPAQQSVINDLQEFHENSKFRTDLTRAPSGQTVPGDPDASRSAATADNPGLARDEQSRYQSSHNIIPSALDGSSAAVHGSGVHKVSPPNPTSSSHVSRHQVRGSIGALLNHDVPEELNKMAMSPRYQICERPGQDNAERSVAEKEVVNGQGTVQMLPSAHFDSRNPYGTDGNRPLPVPDLAATQSELPTLKGNEDSMAQSKGDTSVVPVSGRKVGNDQAPKRTITSIDLAHQLAAATQESSNEQLKASGNIDLMWPQSFTVPVGKIAALDKNKSSIVQPNDMHARLQDANVENGTVPNQTNQPDPERKTDLHIGSSNLEIRNEGSCKKTEQSGNASLPDDLPRRETQTRQSTQVGAKESEAPHHEQNLGNEDDGEREEIQKFNIIERSKSGLKQRAKRQRARGGNRRRPHHVSMMSWDQDDNGRLTVPIVFPDSPQTVSLNMYEKKSIASQEEIRSLLLEDTGLDLYDLEKNRQKEKKDWLRDVDVLEKIFWTSLKKGVNGKPVTVCYGVDVEAEGAFDSTGKGYVEWYGVDNTGRMVKKNKKELRKTEAKVKEEPKPCNVAIKKESNIDPAEEKQSKVKEEKVIARKVEDDVMETEILVDEGQGSDLQAEPVHNDSHLRKSHVGNLNRNGLLRHMPRMPGINHSMYYVGQLLTRFCWHVEDAFLNSVSYLHHGSAEKVWYTIPPKHAPAFDAYASENVFAEDLVDEYGSGQALLMNKTTMFDPRDVRRLGIEVFRVVHKPGTFVLTAPRGYHAGFNCGFNVAEAVNFALPTWFPVGREASRFARENRKPLCVPWEYLLFHEAKALRDQASRKQRTGISRRLMQNAAILASELGTLTSRGEQKIREYAARRNCRIAMLSEIDVLVKNNQLGPEFGHGAGMVCSLCGHACHFYAEICSSCDDSFEARCEQHFGQGPKLCKVAGHKTILVRRHDPVLLADVLTTLEEMAGIKRSKEEMLSRYTGYLRPWETPMRSSGLRLRMNLKLAASRLPPNLASAKACKDGSKKERRRRKRSDAGKRGDGESDEERRFKRKRKKSESTRKGSYALEGNEVNIRRKAVTQVDNVTVHIPKDDYVQVSVSDKKSIL